MASGLLLLVSATWVGLSQRRDNGPGEGTPELLVPGTRPQPAVEQMVRVAVSKLSPEITIEVTGAFRVERLGGAGGKPLWQSPAIGPTKAAVAGNALKVGSRSFSLSAIEIIPEKSPAVWVGDRLYRGRMRLHRVGKLVLAVNVLPLEDYIASVVDSEMPATFPLEARKAQAIVARTFALYQRDACSADALSELTADVKSQKYLGYHYRSGGKLLAGETAAGRQAALETRGQVCTYQGATFCTYYSAVCGGRTLLGSEIFPDAAPVLQSVPCEFCREARLYRWKVEVSPADVFKDVQQYLDRQRKSVGRVRGVQPVGRTQPGELPEFEVRGDRQTATLTGFELRVALAARGVFSPRFTLQEGSGRIIISGQGHGHGAGLCQWGAKGLAEQNRTGRQIVEHYFPGASVR